MFNTSSVSTRGGCERITVGLWKPLENILTEAYRSVAWDPRRLKGSYMKLLHESRMCTVSCCMHEESLVKVDGHWDPLLRRLHALPSTDPPNSIAKQRGGREGLF